MTAIYTTAIDKGGPGKTTITVNGGSYLSEKKDKKVLEVDLDPSCNLTNFYSEKLQEMFDQDETGALVIPDKHTVKAFYTESPRFDRAGHPDPIQISENKWLIAGYSDLYDLTSEVTNGLGRAFLIRWFYDHYDEINESFEYILIDTHNDFSVFTDGALALSDIVLAIADADRDAISKFQEEVAHVDYIKRLMTAPNGVSYVNAKVVKVGNKVNSASSDAKAYKKAFDAMLEADESFVGYFEQRVPFAKAKSTRESLVEIEGDYKDKDMKAFFARTWRLYDKIYQLHKDDNI